MRRALLCLTPIALGACGGGGALPSSNPDLRVVPFQLASGNYQIVSLTDKSDACRIDDPSRPLLNSFFTLIHDGVGGVNLERFGQGKLASNQGTLARAGRFDIGSCTFDFNTTVAVTVVADHHLRGDFVETQTNRAVACVPAGPCTSSWKMELKKP